MSETGSENASAVRPGRVKSPEDEGISYTLSPDLVTLSDARAAEAEAIRTMRTHIMARHLDDGRRGLAMCAATKGAGCTFLAANLAVSLAQIGVKTLLIDGDLRAPSIDQLIRPSQPSNGLKQCIMSPDLHPNDQIHVEVLPNLAVLYAGGVADNAQELLGAEAFKTLMERCLRDFDFTIVDTPPTNLCADARRIRTIIGYSVVVAKRNVSYYGEMASLAAQLEEDGARVVGTVLNEV
ncbi:MAG: CpsD/CapB family tyrosine-protein kinase [Phenylobacterium sp.]